MKWTAVAIATFVIGPHAVGQDIDCWEQDETICRILASDGIQMVDGDTFIWNGEVFSLWGIEAPDRGRMCANEAGVLHEMGEIPTSHLAFILAGGFRCRRIDTDEDGKILAQCFMPNGTDIGQYQVQWGFAWDVPEISGGYYAEDELASHQLGWGAMWNWNCDPPLGPGSQD